MQLSQKVQSQTKTTNFYAQLFQLPLKQALHSGENKQENQQKTSQITEYLLNKIRDNSCNPWSLLEHIPNLIKEFFQIYSAQFYNSPGKKSSLYRIQGSVHFVNPQLIFIGNGTVIEHGSMIAGPCIIGQNCQLRKGSYIRGNVILGDNTLLGNSSQIKNAILMDNCQISHFNYIGDSILGIKAHFAAGAKTSNYKLDGSEIKIDAQKDSKKDFSISNTIGQKSKEVILTGRNKLGALVGHSAEIGCNAILNPGSVIGKSSVIYPLVSWRGQLSSFKICKLVQQNVVVEKL